MCMIKYVPSPWVHGQRNFDLPCCHIASIKWCNALFPGIQGTLASRIDFDRSATRNVIVNHLLFAYNCPYYGHAPVERPLPAEWYYVGLFEIFIIDHLPTPKARFTTSAAWVAERMMEAEMARAQRERNQQVAGQAGGDGNRGEQVAADGGNEAGEQAAAERENAGALMTPDRSSPIGEEGGNRE